MSDADHRGIDEVVRRLSETIGAEKAHQVVESALRRIDDATADRLLSALSAEPGLVGAAARVARARMKPVEGEAPALSKEPVSSRREPLLSAAPAASAPTVEVEQLASLFAESLGNDKSRETVLAALKRDNLPLTAIDESQALRVLERLAREPGIVGVTARFAKARLILLFPR